MGINGHFLECDHHLINSDYDAFRQNAPKATIACLKLDGICHNTLDAGIVSAIASYSNSQIFVTVRGILETAHPSLTS